MEIEKPCGIELSKILEFPATPGFGKWKKFFPEESTAHPAKINLNLLNYLISRYTEEGDTILDPMCGTGSTGVIAALNGRNAILIELEEKFCQWIREAKEKVEQQQTITKKGKIIVIQGDARNIPALLKEHSEEISSAITSSPFAGTSGGKGEKSRDPINERYPGVFDRCIGGNKGALSEDPKQIDNLKYGIVDNIISSPPFGNRLADGELGDDNERGRMKYSSAGANDTHNIGFLPLLDVDSVIFSPPYSLGHDSGDNASGDYAWRLKEQRKHTRAYSPENIAKMPLGFDESKSISCVLFSPPYAKSVSAKNDPKRRAERLKEHGYDPKTIIGGKARCGEIDWQYSDLPNRDNIGNLGYASIDEIITSPPYHHSLHDTAEKRLEWDNTCDQAKADKGAPVGCSGDPMNIGNITTFGFDVPISTILFSPPYESSLEGGSRHTKGGIASRDPKMAQTGTYATTMSFGVPVGYSANDENIGNLKMSDKEIDNTIKRLREHGRSDTKAGGPFGRSLGHPYSDESSEFSEKNIGNLKSGKDEYNGIGKDNGDAKGKDEDETKNRENGGKKNTQVKDKESYLTAMEKVYKGCFEVLKPQGRMILIVKNFIRNKKLVPLSEHTVRLCQSIGFSLEDHLLFKLPQTSFWRILERKKWENEGREYPEDLSYEHILVFRKEKEVSRA